MHKIVIKVHLSLHLQLGFGYMACCIDAAPAVLLQRQVLNIQISARCFPKYSTDFDINQNLKLSNFAAHLQAVRKVFYVKCTRAEV